MTTPSDGAAYAVRLIQANYAAARSAASITGGAYTDALAGGALDDKRGAAWCEYGWPTQLEFANFKHLYDRQGIANGVVNLLAGKCWEDSPRLIEGLPAEVAQPATPWEQQVTAILKRARFWRSYAEADLMRIVGGWSGLLLRMSDDAKESKWDRPIRGTSPRLVSVTPAWRGQLKPTLNQQNGAVESWQYVEASPTDVSGASPRTLNVHPDRIVIVGNWRTGVSMLRAPYNAFVNLEKISGGSGESFLKNAARQIHLNFDKDVDLNSIAQAYGVKPEDLQEVFNTTAQRMNRGNDLVLATQGATATPLVATVPDPKAHAELNLSEVAASFRIPVKVIVGMQTGERASTEDIKDFNRRGMARRTHVLSFDTEDGIDQLIRIRVLPAPTDGDGYHVWWSDLTEASDSERLDNAAKMATINKDSAGTGQAVPFTSDEIRQAAGKESLEDADATGGPGENLSPEDLAAYVERLREVSP